MELLSGELVGNPFLKERVQELTPVVGGKGGCGGCLINDCVLDTVIQSRQQGLGLVYFNGCWMSHKPLMVRQLGWP